ncbi:MAG: plasma membrane calcium [Ramalina farinacea]|uniref:Calcium-transporting ATPase n=1 Tax=Ramalina farinacea TaxID=258253 RepID=A0AA43QI26_9LECA|nr:plasma membrane calcium [Ramalina farinacea]
MTSHRLLAPPISIRTNVSHSEGSWQASTDMSKIHHENRSSTDGEISPIDDSEAGPSLQLSPPSPTAQSLGGDTLRSRSDSFNSTTAFSEAETTRSRANSDIKTIRSRFEGDELTAEEALKPDKTNEKGFEIPSNPFAFSPGQLNKVLNPKSLAAYRALGGIWGLEEGLQTDLVAGLSADESAIRRRVTLEEARRAATEKKQSSTTVSDNQHLPAVTDHENKGQYHDRQKVYKDNRLPVKKSLNIWQHFWIAAQDKVLIILTIAAVVSLALGIYEAVEQKAPPPGQPDEGPSVDWVEGLAIEVAVVIVILVTGLGDYRREKQFTVLNAKKEDRQVKAVRSGKSVLISVFDVMVGDVLHLESGDSIPADGVLISGHGIRCDESSATGESDAMKKTDGHEVWSRIQNGTATSKLDPFIISGSKVLEGVGTYLVTSVGVNSSFGKVMMAVQTETEETPLQVKLGHMATWIGYLGTAAAGLLFTILLIRFLANLSSNTATSAVKGSQFLDILIVAITIIVVAVPEGLPVAVTLALSFATKKMLKENNLVRHLRACETMGNATTICSDKTGTLTQNKMTVVAGMMGSNVQFDKNVQQDEEEAHQYRYSSVFDRISLEARTLLLQSCAINSTAFEGEEEGKFTFIGSKTETAILGMAKEQLGMGPVAEERAGAEIVQLIPFDSDRKCMGVVIRLSSGTYRLLVKGAAEILVEKSTSTLSDPFAPSVSQTDMSGEAKGRVMKGINDFAADSLRTIAFVYNDYPQWPPIGSRTLEDDQSMAVFEDVFHDMNFLGLVGIQDPVRDGVSKAVKQCQDAGVVVRMVTGDNVMTANAIAIQCGIKTPDGVVMEGPKFRQLSDAEMDGVLPRLQVLARSSPDDKRILVSRLKHLGETVAVTGDGTNDGPALKLSDVGFSMGIAGTEVAKEASAIILMDDNFSSIVKAIMWGRSVNDAVAKFLQFQITVNITAVALAFISAVSSSTGHSVLSAVQLLWVNLIMDTFAALALATDPPTEKILDRKPTPKSAPLITTNMWKMITGQAVYQLAVTLVLYFAGPHIFDYSQKALDTVVFNTFVWMQIFNQFNNRRLDNKLNVFEGIHRNWFFMAISLIMVGGQIMIIFVGGAAFQIQALTGPQWAVSILCALPCFVWAIVLRCIPDKYAAVVFGVAGRVYFFFYRPLIKALSFVFKPIGKVLKAVLAPTKRFSKRTKAAVFRKGSVADKASDDEEAGVKMADVDAPVPQTPVKLKSPITPPPPDVMVSPPPPITVSVV